MITVPTETARKSTRSPRSPETDESPTTRKAPSAKAPAVKSTSSRATSTRPTARKTATTTPAEPEPDAPATSRRRNTASDAAATPRRRATPPAEPAAAEPDSAPTTARSRRRAAPDVEPAAEPARETAAPDATARSRRRAAPGVEPAGEAATPDATTRPRRRAAPPAAPEAEPAAEPVGRATRARRSTPAADAVEAPPAGRGARRTRAAQPGDPEPEKPKRTRAKSAPAEPEPAEPPARPTRRRSSTSAESEVEPSARTAQRWATTPAGASAEEAKAPSETEAGTEETAQPHVEMTRGIVELAAERLAASAAAAPPAEPADQVLGRSNASPRRTSRSTGTGGRSSGLGSRAQGSAGTRPGAGSRPPLASRPPAGPPEAVRPPADMARLDAETYPEPFTWATHPDERSDEAPEAGYPRIANRPAAGLPESVRLPAELPDNCWPPHALLERHSTENIYVPAPVLPDAEPAAPAEKVTEELPGARLYVPPRPVEPAQEPEPEPEPDSAFLPTVLARDEEEAPDYVPSRSRDRTARHAASPAGPSTRTRRRRAVLLAYVLVVAVVLVIGHQLRNDEQPIAPGREAAQRAAEPAGPAPTDVPAAAPQAVEAEAGEFRYAKGRGPMLGTGGRVHRFQVAVEKTVDGPAPADFADEIDRTLGDERSWISEGDVRLRRVPRSAGNADFTIYLASATTSEQMCATAGLQTAGFTSCRVPGKVIINADRWADGIPDYAGHLAEYRRYAINHEVGHELGHGHELCPGEGRPAPVMMQQTYGLKGCTRNAWPYLDGERYAGEPTA